MTRGNSIYKLSLEPLTSVHLHSGRPGGFESGNIDNVRLFCIIAVFTLLIATFNFANLATAQAVDRIKAIGIHKVLGASRRRVFGQFMGETILLSLFACLLAALTAKILFPTFNQLAGKGISIDTFSDPQRMIALLTGSILAGIAAGIYPALFLSGYPVLTALKEAFQPGKSSIVVSRLMLIAQFTLAFILMLGTLVIKRQLHYMRSADPGFTPSQLLVVDTRGEAGAYSFKREIASLPGVLSASFSSEFPGSDKIAVISLAAEEASGRMIDTHWAGCSVDFDYISTFDIRMAAGRAFSRNMPTDTLKAVIINEAAAHSLGYNRAADAIGRRCIRNGLPARVIGVVKDFHTRSFRESIAPLILWLQSRGDDNNYLTIRLSPSNLPVTLAALAKPFATSMPNRPFDYFFLDDYFAGLYRSEFVFGRLFDLFALLAIFLSCIGMLGFTAFELSLRRKEIGMRKILGASVQSIFRLLFADLLRPILLALLIGAPIAGLLVRSWLDHYAYRINPGVSIFFFTGGLLLMIVVVTVVYQATRSALVSPLKVIKKD